MNIHVRGWLLVMSAGLAIACDPGQLTGASMQAAAESGPLMVLSSVKRSTPSSEVPRAEAAEPKTPGTLRGRVLEQLDTSAYSYLRLATDSGESWCAVPLIARAIGTTVTIGDLQFREGFVSKSLRRKFPRIWFGTLASGSPLAARSQGIDRLLAGGQQKSGKNGSGRLIPRPEEMRVERATGPNAHTISEVWSKRSTLQGRQVRVRGRVVKVVEQVMGRNWVQLQDGSGGGRTLTVTTQDPARVGEVAVAEGIVRTDQAFGTGNSYSVLVELASLKR